MNAKQLSVQSQNKPANENKWRKSIPPPNENKWRESITSENVALISGLIEAEGKEGLVRAGEVVNLTPYRTAPKFALDNALNEQAFSTGDLKHHIEFLLSDDRDLDKMRSRMEWLMGCRGKLAWMERKLTEATDPKTVSASVSQQTLAAQNEVMMASFALRDYKGGNAERISELTLAVEQAKNHLRTVVKTAREEVLSANTAFSVKVEGLRKAIEAAGDIETAIERIDTAGMMILAKRTLAGLIQGVLDERTSVLEEQQAATSEVEAIMASVVPEVMIAAKAKKAKKVKVPAKSRGEVSAKSLEEIGSAIVHKQVADMSAKRVSKEQAIELAGVPADVFEIAAAKAEVAGEEEVLVNTSSKAVIFVRRVGDTRRFFAKVAEAK